MLWNVANNTEATSALRYGREKKTVTQQQTSLTDDCDEHINKCWRRRGRMKRKDEKEKMRLHMIEISGSEVLI